MSSQSSFVDPVQPGPFQKYLFSGACYVQIGECYRLFCKSLESGQLLSNSTELTARLAAIWHDQAMQRSAMAALMPAGSSPLSGLQNGAGFYVEINNALVEIGQAATTSLLNQLQLNRLDSTSTEQAVPDLDQFFMLWASSCADAYDQLVRSEWFSSALGAAVNQWVRTAK